MGNLAVILWPVVTRSGAFAPPVRIRVNHGQRARALPHPARILRNARALGRRFGMADAQNNTHPSPPRDWVPDPQQVIDAAKRGYWRGYADESFRIQFQDAIRRGHKRLGRHDNKYPYK